jgi:ATP-dependent protease ClpP protease subunit
MRLLMAITLSAFCSTAYAQTTTRLFIDGDIEELGAMTIAESIKNAGDDASNVVILEINSPGGDIEAGFKIVRAIERSRAHVLCVVDGEADSMASYVFESCHTRAMTRRSLLMIHEPSISGVAGQPTKLKDAAEYTAVLSNAILEFYAGKLKGITLVELGHRTAGGASLWLGWKEAQHVGAVDIVVDLVSDLFPGVSK